jgi:arsenate reductase
MVPARWPTTTLRAWHDGRVAGQSRGSPVQVFGLGDSASTRAAQRFFKERRIEVHFVDLRRKPIAPGELRRFVDRFGARALADADGPSWRAAGMGYLRMDDAELVDRLLSDQRLLRLPLVRSGAVLCVGRDEAAWKTAAAAAIATGLQARA